MPRILSMVIEPRNSPASTRNTRSRRACKCEVSIAWSVGSRSPGISSLAITVEPFLSVFAFLFRQTRFIVTHYQQGIAPRNE